MSRKARLIALAALLVTLVGCDQATKQYATQHLQHTRANPLQFCGDTFEIRYAENEGAFLSLFANFPPRVRFWLLTVMNAVILAGVAWLLVSHHSLDRRSFTALSLLLAGGIGNLIDRIWLGGIVIDFMVVDLGDLTGVGWLKTGIFNVADMAITAGFLLLVPTLFRRDAPPAPPAEAAA
jgi:signal peptidase II